MLNRKRAAMIIMIVFLAVSIIGCSAGLIVRKSPAERCLAATRLYLQKDLDCLDRIYIQKSESRQTPPWTEEQLPLLSHKVDIFGEELIRSMIRYGFVISEDVSGADLILTICTVTADFEMRAIALGAQSAFSADGYLRRDSFHYAEGAYIPSDVRLITYEVFLISPGGEQLGVIEKEVECTPAGHSTFANELCEYTKRFFGLP